MTQTDSPLSRLPRKQEDPSERMRAILSAKHQDGGSPAKPPVQTDPQPAPEPKQKRAPKAKPSRPFIRKDKILPAFWTVASLVSMTVNIVLAVVLISLLNNLSKITLELSSVTGLPGELYHNFELMDRAHIQTIIPVDAQVPVSFDLELDSQTVVTLSEDVRVRGAFVTIDTPLIDINAPANVVLPAGTSLPIRLQMTVPVETNIPIHIDVPVDIDLGQTGLHIPFTGLREAVKPFYCMLEPEALSVDGQPVCR